MPEPSVLSSSSSSRSGSPGKNPSPDIAMETPSSSKATITAQLQAVKQLSRKTYSQIAEETGLTNVYVAQLLRRQAQLNPATAGTLKKSLPGLTDDLLAEMIKPPLRSYDPNLIQEPTVYRSLLFSLFLQFLLSFYFFLHAFPSLLEIIDGNVLLLYSFFFFFSFLED